MVSETNLVQLVRVKNGLGLWWHIGDESHPSLHSDGWWRKPQYQNIATVSLSTPAMCSVSRGEFLLISTIFDYIETIGISRKAVNITGLADWARWLGKLERTLLSFGGYCKNRNFCNTAWTHFLPHLNIRYVCNMLEYTIEAWFLTQIFFWKKLRSLECKQWFLKDSRAGVTTRSWVNGLDRYAEKLNMVYYMYLNVTYAHRYSERWLGLKKKKEHRR